MTPYRPISYLERNTGVAIWEAGDEMPFEVLREHVRRMQRLLAARGVGDGDVVAVQLPNVWQYVALELAIPDMGAVILPLPLSLGEHELRWVQEKARPVLVVRDLMEESADGLPAPPSAEANP